MQVNLNDEREAIARIIAPEAAACRDKIEAGVQSWHEERGVKYEAWGNRWNVNYKFAWDRALEKADQIIAALQTKGGDDRGANAALSTPETYREDGFQAENPDTYLFPEEH